MDTPNGSKLPNGRGRSRRTKNTITTKSGNTLKINRSLGDRKKAGKAARAAEKATYLSTLPKERFKRILYRLHPKRVAKYWFSRQGAIMGLKLVGIGIVAVFFLTIGMFAYFRKDLPKIKDISGSKLGGTNTYYDRSGQTVLWQDYSARKRIPVEGKDVSKYVKQATIAIEDKDFYKHGAFDVRGITRAAYNDAKGSGGAVQGGSTITQQLVKLNQDWTTNRTVTRKVKELILAVELEREYSKDDIINGYLNIAPYGGVEYGVESAARDYFHTTAKDLTLEQATMLAAIPQSPSYYSPYASSRFNSAVTADTFSGPSLIGRQHYILDQMVTQGYVTRAQADAAKKVDILAEIQPQSPKYQNIKAPYFVLAAKQQLEQQFGSTVANTGGWKVVTTLNLDLQNKAEQLVASNIPNIQRNSRGNADEEAIVNEDVETGEIVSQVGGTNFFDTDHGENNYAAGIRIPPGSSFKPYDYTTLIDNNNNVGAGSVLYDTQGKLDSTNYPCTVKTSPKVDKEHANCLWDYDFNYPGPITLRYALGGSRNVPAVKAMLSAVPNDNSPGHIKSVNKVIDTASAMMYNPYVESHKQKTYNCYAQGTDVNYAKPSDVTQCYGSSAIGDGAFLHLDDHVNGLATLARLGKAIPRTYILKITDSAAKEVKLPQYKARQAIKADTAFIVDDMASDPNASYLPSSYKFQHYKDWHFAVKTGTTNDNYDGLMASWSTKYATVAWVGNHNRNVDLHATMETLTEPLVRGWMEYAHKDVKAVNWTQPPTIKSSAAFVVRNHVGIGSVEPSATNDLFPGHYIGGATTKNTAQTIDRVSNKVATQCTPPAAKQTVGNANVASWNADIFNGGRANIGTGSSSNTSGGSNATDDVHNCSDSSPSITLTAPATCDTSCVITATVTQGTHALTDPQYGDFPGRVTFTLNGQTIHAEQVSDSPSTISFTYTPTENGNGSVVATVYDSVLYSGSQSSPIAYTIPAPVAAAPQAALTLNLGGKTAASQSLNWNSLGAGTTYSFCYGQGSPTTCVSTQGTNYTVPGVPNKSYVATISSGALTSSVNWTQ